MTADDEPRATNDIDIVLSLPLGRIQAFVDALGPRFQVDVEMLRDALLHARSCNVFFLPRIMKVGLFAVGLRVSAAELDSGYQDSWAKRLNLGPLLSKARSDAEAD